MIVIWFLEHVGEIYWTVTFLLAIWVAIDACRKKVPVDKKPYGLNNGALAWFLTTLVFSLWIFLYYLWKRHRVLKHRRESDEYRSRPKTEG